MSNPELAAVLRNMKVPERMTGSQALRDFLLTHTEGGEDVQDSQERAKRLNWLLVISHLEVVNALGALEERITEARNTYVQAELGKRRRRGRWF